jgi:hypothetical protein
MVGGRGGKFAALKNICDTAPKGEGPWQRILRLIDACNYDMTSACRILLILHI